MSSCILFLLLVVSTWLSNLAVVYESHICKLTLRGIHNFTFFLTLQLPVPSTEAVDSGKDVERTMFRSEQVRTTFHVSIIILIHT